MNGAIVPNGYDMGFQFVAQFGDVLQYLTDLDPHKTVIYIDYIQLSSVDYCRLFFASACMKDMKEAIKPHNISTSLRNKH